MRKLAATTTIVMPRNDLAMILFLLISPPLNNFIGTMKALLNALSTFNLMGHPGNEYLFPSGFK